MDNIRLNKVSRLLQKELGIYFQMESQRQFKGVMISVTVVRVSPDLGVARVYISIFPNAKIEESIEIIRLQSKTIRYHIAAKLKTQLRRMPDLEFFIDDSLDYADKIENLLD